MRLTLCVSTRRQESESQTKTSLSDIESDQDSASNEKQTHKQSVDGLNWLCIDVDAPSASSTCCASPPLTQLSGPTTPRRSHSALLIVAQRTVKRAPRQGARLGLWTDTKRASAVLLVNFGWICAFSEMWISLAWRRSYDQNNQGKTLKKVSQIAWWQLFVANIILALACLTPRSSCFVW